MAEKRKCLCCGKAYEYCPNCGKSSTPWKVNFDTESCKELFNIISAFNMNLVNKDKVKEIVTKYSITDYSNYNEKVTKVLNSIISNNQIVEIAPESNVVGDDTPAVENIINDISEVDQPFQVEEIKEEIPRRRRNKYFE